MRRLAEEEEDISEREALEEAAQAAAAAASADATEAGFAQEETLLRLPLRAGAVPPTYGAQEAAAAAAGVSPAALPFLKWPSAAAAADRTGDRDKNGAGGIGLSPMAGGGAHSEFLARGNGGVQSSHPPPPPRLPSPGPGVGGGMDARPV